MRVSPAIPALPPELNGIDPEAWLAAVLSRISDHPTSRLDELLPWNWPRLATGQAA
jgi:transposase